MESLSARASIQIQKPVSAVFEAIVNPEQMCRYFIQSGSGRLESGKTVEWNFPEFPAQFPVKVLDVKQDSSVSFDWSGGGANQMVEIVLQSMDDNRSTVVKITEHEMTKDEEGILLMMRQTEGWANFLACLKAYLEYGINLRKGAFDFMKG